MSLFQTNIVRKYIACLNEQKIEQAYTRYKQYFFNEDIQTNIRLSKEEQFQEGFLRELFVNILGYIINPNPNYNLITEKKNEIDSGKTDAAIIINNEVIGVIELKDYKTVDLKKIETQAFSYKNKHRNAIYVITSNFEKLRFYIDNSVDYEEFSLFRLSKQEFSLLYICLAYENIEKGLPKKIKHESVSAETNITNTLYKDYSEFKRLLFADILEQNKIEDSEQKIILFKKTQKLLDRFIFIFFAEDSGLLEPNTIKTHIIGAWQQMCDIGEYQPLYNRFKKIFSWLNDGFKGKDFEVFAYNGGLFKPDDILDNIIISDNILLKYTTKLSEYDYISDVDVNILGHIFEHSLTEIEDITKRLLTNDTSTIVSKRKKDGVYYTPQYITKYIVENTVGRLCTAKKDELGIIDNDYYTNKRRHLSTKQTLYDKLETYRKWLLGITICDPACGSGAFLNEALQFLIKEHHLIDEMQTKLAGGSIVFPNIEKVILENNLYGVDINEESVEIAKLSLWIRTAQPHRKLSSLNNNIKCGNSLIADSKIAGLKAFRWQDEFPQIFNNGGFDIVIGNPPYVDSETMTKTIPEQRAYITQEYKYTRGNWDMFIAFIEKAINITKRGGLTSLIIPNKFIAAKYAIELRKMIASKELLEIVDYSNVQVFQDIAVYPCIILLSNSSTVSNVKMTCMQSEHDIKYTNIISSLQLKDGICWDKYFFSPNIVALINKITSHPCLNVFLPDIFGAATVAEAYQIKDKLLDSKDADSTKKLINTGTIDRYASLWGFDKTQYIKGQYSYPRISNADILAISQNRLRQSEAHKLIIAGMSLRYETYYDTGKYIAGKSTTIILGQPEKLKYAMTIINSKLLSFWLSKSFNSLSMAGGYFNIGVNEVSSIPIPICYQLSDFTNLADTMLQLHNNRQELLTQFLRILSANFAGINKTRALVSSLGQSFTDFIKELKKQKINIPINTQDELLKLYDTYNLKYITILQEIAATEHRIDTLVYGLYNLTEEEISIVEANVLTN